MQTSIDFYKTYFSARRLRSATIPRDLNLEFLSDQGRIIPSPAFRRLQAKAQVFSLEENAAVRTRLTHSLEVACHGKIIAEKVFQGLVKLSLIESSLNIPFVSTVENACLLHDIGNPPFGHFAEYAIQGWFKKNQEELLKKHSELLNGFDDFMYFDGNAQGFRIITKLSWLKDTYGLNLTCALLGAYVKYPSIIPTQKKKLGVFFSEKKILDEITSINGLSESEKSPLNLIMEAADDIAYCLSDIEDGIEKGIIRFSDLIEFLHARDCDSTKVKYKIEKDISKKLLDKSEFVNFKILIVQQLIEESVSNYLTNHDLIIRRQYSDSLLSESSPQGMILKNLKSFAKKHLFFSKEAVDLELFSFSVVEGILEKFKNLILLSENDFMRIMEGTAERGEFELEKRLYSLLPERHVVIYKHGKERFPEIHCRVHLVLDYLTGMTDSFAKDIYQVLEGISAKVRE